MFHSADWAGEWLVEDATTTVNILSQTGEGAGYSPFFEPNRAPLRGGGIHRWAVECLLNCLGSLAGNLGELAHPEGAEREQDAR